MNNKGFTLIELIATIGIMLMIGLVIVNNMSGLFSKQNDQDYDQFVAKLEESACMYVETKWDSTTRNSCKTSNSCSVTIDELIESGYIEDSLKDPTTGNLITNDKNKYKVNVRWVDYVKTCTING